MSMRLLVAIAVSLLLQGADFAPDGPEAGREAAPYGTEDDSAAWLLGELKRREGDVGIYGPAARRG